MIAIHPFKSGLWCESNILRQILRSIASQLESLVLPVPSKSIGCSVID
ncbi:unnamed protein product [Haemonchus placei]|uniref:Uncharacterized protein n=1 Tax=Haemonchus placei TaxID=6290 RepID=A0A3P7WR50_HAEPC|nr:unnamed protein product [Haemonchus placei]